MSSCTYQRAVCRRPCGAPVTSWHSCLCAMHAHWITLDVDPEEGELLHKAYRATKGNQLCIHELRASECATCLGVPHQAWEEVA